LAIKEEREKYELTEKTDSVAGQNKTMQISVYFMDDISDRQKVKIEEALKASVNPAVRFDQYGIKSASYQFIDNVVGVIKENPDIRLELALHAVEDESPGNKMLISEKWAQELAFYFENKGINMDSFSSKGNGWSHPTLKPVEKDSIKIDGIIEFIFMKN
jgi:outer membrane protein OmpA-like peptidoglycan-associated protein